jgi:hypothetical protein
MKMTELDNSVRQDIAEGWSQKYKNSINCSHPKGFSQKAHCAGKKKHTESIEMEMTCPDCGMCQSHGTLNEIKKGQKDSNGFTKCWPGKHAEGTKKGKNGKPVRNCVPNESVAESRHNYDDNRTGFRRSERDMDDESNLLYIYKDGRVMQKMVSNRVEREARSQGYRDTPEQALKMHGIVKSKFKPGKWVQKQGDSWPEVFPFGKPDGLQEFASAPGNMTTAANVGVGAVYKNKPIKQPKNKDGTAKNALDMKGANLLGGGSVKR